MAQNEYDEMVLLLFPTTVWNLYGLELRWLRSVGDAFRQGDFITAEDGPDRDLKRLVKLCHDIEPESIYQKTGKKSFRTQKKFFDNADEKVRRHVTNLTGRRIAEAVGLAANLGVHIYFKPKLHDFIEPSDELTYVQKPVELHTFYRKTDDGLDYKLTVGKGFCPSMHRTVIICNEPSLFCIDNRLMHFDDGLNGNLIRPFIKSKWMHIPERMTGTYFRTMILKIASKIDIDAEGFEVTDLHPEGTARLTLEHTISGKYHFRLSFDYAGKSFEETSIRKRSVTLNDDGKTVNFVSIHRNMEWESSVRSALDNQLHMPRACTLSEALDWVKTNGDALSSLGVSMEQLTNHKYYIGDVRITSDEKRIGDWFQLHIMLHFDDGQVIPLMALRQALLTGEKEYPLPNGDWFVIPDEWFAKYSPMMMFGHSKDKETVGVHRSQREVIDALGDSRLRDTETLNIDYTLPEGLNTTLRPYQLEGYKWLLGHVNAGTGCCLSDDMGLGKTVQSIALILKYRETATEPDAKSVGVAKPKTSELSLFSEEEMSGRANVNALPVLVVAPASVVYNWRNEISRFASSLKVLQYVGNIEQRHSFLSVINSYDVVITTYATMRNDIEFLSKKQWGITIFDESQVFKNSDSLTYEAIKKLDCPRRVALSGTPMENNLRELWSLMDVLNPNLLGDRADFQRNFIHPINENLKSKSTEILRKLVAPYFLRRTKAEVLDSLPERQDEIVYCDMEPQQMSLYVKELSRMRNFLLQKDVKSNAINALTIITRMRQIACAPAMIGYPTPSGKLMEVYPRLEELHGTTHKVLIFSEFVTLLNIVSHEMSDRGWNYAMLTGQTSNREEVINYFQKEPTCQFFLISLKAGGLGLNLTEADYVFLLDPWWNVTAEEQAISRAHRQGQKRSVFVYRFISKGTLEEQILKVQDRKQSLINAVLSFMK